MAISNASNPLGRLKNGHFKCYRDRVLPEEECKAHFSLSGNASSGIIISMRNLLEQYLKTYLISVYDGPNSKIKTLWIKVIKKVVLSTTSVSAIAHNTASTQISATTTSVMPASTRIHNTPFASLPTAGTDSSSNQKVALAVSVPVSALFIAFMVAFMVCVEIDTKIATGHAELSASTDNIL